MQHESAIFFRHHNASVSRNEFPYLTLFSTVASGSFFKIYFSSTTIQNSNSKFAIKFSFMYLLHIWLYTCTIDLSGDIKKNPGPRPRTGWKVSKYGPEKTPYSNNFHKVQFLLNFFDLPLEPKQYNCAFLC